MTEVHVLRHVRQVVLAAMRRDGFFYMGEKRHDPLPWDINNGWCEEFAELACRAIPGAEALWLDDDVAHCVVVIGGRYFDAEALDGVDRETELPIYRQSPRPDTEHVGEAYK